MKVQKWQRENWRNEKGGKQVYSGKKKICREAREIKKEDWGHVKTRSVSPSPSPLILAEQRAAAS